jgi:FkbM family methyltransferase
MNDAVTSEPDRDARERPAVPTRAGIPGLLIRQYFPGFSPAVVFDVGANVGRSATAFVQAFPGAMIYAFEPVTSVFRTLEVNIEGLPRVRAFNTALGRRSGRAHVTKRPASTTNRIVEPPNLLERPKTENVAITSGDEFAAEHGIEQIGFLKIDAEGHDLDVLVGFQRMLSARRIDLLETEVGMNRDNRRHVPFEAVKAYLEPIGYRLFHIYDLAMDTPFSGRVVLRRANVMFVSDVFVEANRVRPGQP